ncbi:MAG: 50S ribosomal protein L29 [Flavobacteriales bacterium]|nr:50S ribosomal protein L29 [Flavobacteriaceae bacterium]PHX92919.1 MAG: 50S ribosomal protein L29 [Flavobacteriales bacterium]
MKYEDIKALPNKELVERYKEEKSRLIKMRFQNAVSQIENPHKMKEAKKDVARFMTELNARRHEAEMNAQERKMNQSQEN